MSRFRSRLSYSNVVATLALFIALGGGAYAVTNAPKNSVTSKSIKKGAVKKPDLGANAVDSSKVGDGSLLTQDFAAGQLPKGDKGDKGDTGPTTAAANTENGNPAASPFPDLVPTTITTPTAGKLFVLGDAPGMLVGCSGSPCSVDIGLYVDGQPVPGTKRSFSAGAGMVQTKSLTISGVTGTLPAGIHTVSFRRINTSGSVIVFTSNDSHTSAIALGG